MPFSAYLRKSPNTELAAELRGSAPGMIELAQQIALAANTAPLPSPGKANLPLIAEQQAATRQGITSWDDLHRLAMEKGAYEDAGPLIQKIESLQGSTTDPASIDALRQVGSRVPESGTLWPQDIDSMRSFVIDELMRGQGIGTRPVFSLLDFLERMSARSTAHMGIGQPTASRKLTETLPQLRK